MRYFVYEHVSGGGLLSEDAACDASLAHEGRAMLRAIAEDLASEPANRVDIMIDAHLDVPLESPHDNIGRHDIRDADERDGTFAELASRCDRTILVAPETRGILLGIASRAVELGARLVSPSPRSIALAGDKWLMREHLKAHGIRVARAELGTPFTLTKVAGVDARTGLVIKPRDGAGSDGLSHILADSYYCGQADMMLEEFIPGRAASVAGVGGPHGVLMLPPFWQHIDYAQGFQYRGGSLIEDERLAARATRLAQSVLTSIDGFVGYMGVDLVLGEREDGHDDTVIEVNPRLTTSFVGARAAFAGNISPLLMCWIEGERVELPRASFRPVRFRADGHILK